MKWHMDRRAFFLKINRSDDFAVENLSRWLDAARMLKEDCYVICDKQEIVDKIKKRLFLLQDVVFLTSIKNDETEELVKLVARARVWHNAAYAHLSTFIYAKQYGYSHFWNIDADDTWMCIPMPKLKKCLMMIEEYAQKENYTAFSLDMWKSVKKGKCWTFGVAYIENEMDWKAVFLKYGRQKAYENADNEQMDSFFYYLERKSGLKIGTFYFENLRFVHYSSNFLKEPVAAGIYHWHDGLLEFPIRKCFRLDEYSDFKIFDTCVRFDAKIGDRETRDAFSYYTRDINNLALKSHWDNIVDIKLCAMKHKEFMEKHANAKEVVLFGAGHALRFNYKKFQKLCQVRYVCDNNQNLWGKDIYRGIVCISLDEIKKMKDVVVVITIYSKATAEQIAQQLKGLGIKEVDYLENWIRCAE